jgi:hypothetical protein
MGALLRLITRMREGGALLSGHDAPFNGNSSCIACSTTRRAPTRPR